jgi:hypothetical protein
VVRRRPYLSIPFTSSGRRLRFRAPASTPKRKRSGPGSAAVSAGRAVRGADADAQQVGRRRWADRREGTAMTYVAADLSWIYPNRRGHDRTSPVTGAPRAGIPMSGAPNRLLPPRQELVRALFASILKSAPRAFARRPITASSRVRCSGVSPASIARSSSESSRPGPASAGSLESAERGVRAESPSAAARKGPIRRSR